MQVNKSIRKATVWVSLLEVALWLFFGITHFLIQKKFPGEFFFRLPNLLWFNVLVLPYYSLLFYKRAHFLALIATIPSRLIPSFLHFQNNKNYWARWVFFRLAFFFFVLALAQPLFGHKKGMSKEVNSEVVIAMDISNSMNTKDIDPKLSRLEIAKRATTQLINGLKGERIGLIVFAGNAYVQLPITRDYIAAKLFLNEIDTKMLTNQGTDFETAILQAQEMFSKGNAGRCILMVTDGENHEEVPEDVLTDLPEKNITLAVIGLGTRNGGLVPRDPDQPVFGYINDENGQPVLSKVGEELIRKMAQKAQGISMVSEDAFPNLSNLLTEINHINKGELRNLSFVIKKSMYAYPLLLAMVFWLFSELQGRPNWLQLSRKNKNG